MVTALDHGHGDLPDLVAVDEVEPARFRGRYTNPNINGRIYGGQLLAHAVMASAATVPEGRRATNLQFIFLQGAMNDEPVDYRVSTLQEGKRFSMRQVRGSQASGRTTFDAHATFAVPFEAPSHDVRLDDAILREDPESLTDLDGLGEWRPDIERALRYPAHNHAALDLRLPDPPDRMFLDPRAPRLRYWIRVRKSLPRDARVHVAAFAYISDWWLTYVSMGAHLSDLVAHDRIMYLASLNHAIWFHREIVADDWLHFDCASPAAVGGRGLSTARVHDRAGRLVANVTQECLMSVID